MKVRWNMRGFEQVRRLPGVKDKVEEVGNGLAHRAGPGYVASFRHGRTRYRGIVFAKTYRAMKDNARNNTLVKTLGGG